VRRLTFHPRALRFVLDLGLDAKRFRQVTTKILTLIENPEQSDTRPILGYTQFFRVDVGEYRVAYRYDEEDLWIVAVGKRNDDEVYRELEKR
jgi:mRNA interferase RelE/StbE